MARFNYSARAGSAASNGSIDAPNRREAVRLLQARGLSVTQIDEVGGGAKATTSAAASAAMPGAPAGEIRLTRRLRLPFLEALSELVHAGMSAGEAVRLLALRLQEPRLRALCAALWSSLGEGRTLSAAMAEHPEVFDRQTINLIAAGEATGNLREVLARLIQHFTQQRELRQQFLAALSYPAFVCFLGFGVVLFLLFFLMPRLQTLLSSMGGKLPFATRMLVGTSHFLLVYGPFILAAVVITGVVALRWWRTPDGRKQGDAWLLRVPVIGDFIVRAAVLNFTHTLAVLLENGITTAEALRLTERAIDNSALQQRVHEATDRVIEGASLSTALARINMMPPLILDRLSVGEQTGNLAPSLRQIANSAEKDLTRRLHAFTRLVSGTILFFTFGFVAFLAYAIVTALFQVSASIRL